MKLGRKRPLRNLQMPSTLMQRYNKKIFPDYVLYFSHPCFLILYLQEFKLNPSAKEFVPTFSAPPVLQPVQETLPPHGPPQGPPNYPHRGLLRQHFPPQYPGPMVMMPPPGPQVISTLAHYATSFCFTDIISIIRDIPSLHRDQLGEVIPQISPHLPQVHPLITWHLGTSWCHTLR